MNIRNEIVLEDLGLDYKNQENARIRIKTFVNDKILGDKDGIIFISGRKPYMEAIVNNHMSIDDYFMMMQNARN